jgi:agmatinase
VPVACILSGEAAMTPEEGGGGRMNFPFVGIPSFLRSVIVTDLGELDADIAVLGAPFDEGSPFLPGSRFGSRSIREHSIRFVTDGRGYYDPSVKKQYLEREMISGEIADVGDADILPTNVVDSFANITELTRTVVDRGAMPVALGGDHSVTFPVARAFEGGDPFHVVHYDAHIDYMPFIHGLEFTNQHAFRHIRLMKNVRSINQIGIRSLRNTQVMHDDSLRDGNRVVTMEEFRDRGDDAVLEGIPEGARCYVSIDIDALDISLIPGCVSAEPNGMMYAELRDSLAGVADRTEIIGLDLVEVNPLLDVPTGLTSYLAAHTVIEFLGRICEQPWWRSGREARAERRAAARATTTQT